MKQNDLLFVLLRLQYFFYKNNIIILSIFIRKIIRVIYSCDIGISFKVPDGLQFGHSALGVVIHSKAKIGRNVLIGHNVTIGNTRGSAHPPIIKDNCKIYLGSIIIGECIIGENSHVAAGTKIINKSFPSNTLVMGEQGCKSRELTSEVRAKNTEM